MIEESAGIPRGQARQDIKHSCRRLIARLDLQVLPGKGRRQPRFHGTWMQSDTDCLRMSACQFDRRGAHQLIERRLGGPIAIPAAKAIIADTGDPG